MKERRERKIGRSALSPDVEGNTSWKRRDEFFVEHVAIAITHSPGQYTQMKRDTIDPHPRWVAGFPTVAEHHCHRQMNECGRTRDWGSKRCPTFVDPPYLSLSLPLATTSSRSINDSWLCLLYYTPDMLRVHVYACLDG